MEGGIRFSTNDFVIIFTPRFFLCPTVDCARLRAPTVTHFRLAVTDSARVNNPVCLSLPACTGVSVGYGPSRRGAGLQDACVCGCESLWYLTRVTFPINESASLSYQQQRICPVCIWAVASQWWAWAPFQMVKGCLCFFFCELSTHVLCLFFFWVLTLSLGLQEFFLS